MKNPNKLKEFVPFQLNEIDSLKEYLEDMAAKGWKLKTIKKSYYFEKIEPQKLYYSIEIIKRPDFHANDQNDNSNEILQKYREAGWEFVCQKDVMLIFVTENEELKPLENDEKVKLKQIKRNFTKSEPVWRFIFFSIISFIDFDFGLITTNKYVLILYMLIATIIIADFVHIIYYFVWKIKQNIKLKQGKKINYVSLVSFKTKKIIHKSKIYYICIVFLVLVISSITAYFDFEEKNSIFKSSSTFLASTTTYEVTTSDESTISVDIYKSKYEYIIYGYYKLKIRSYDEVNLPEWDAQYIFCSGTRYIIVYKNCVISFSSHESLDMMDVNKIKPLIN